MNANGLAKTIAAALRVDPDVAVRVESETVVATLAATEYTITVKAVETHRCDRCAGLTFKSQARLTEHMENVHHEFADLEAAP